MLWSLVKGIPWLNQVSIDEPERLIRCWQIVLIERLLSMFGLAQLQLVMQQMIDFDVQAILAARPNPCLLPRSVR